MNYTEIFSQIFILVGVLVALVNVITEVVKKIYNFKSAQGVNVFVTIISIVLTVATFIAYFQYKGLTFYWYLVVAFVIVGFMVSYAAMFGFDKLIKYFEDIKL